jgi:hypothetical protein
MKMTALEVVGVLIGLVGTGLVINTLFWLDSATSSAPGPQQRAKSVVKSSRATHRQAA